MFRLLHLVSLDLTQLTLSLSDNEHKPVNTLTCVILLPVYLSLLHTEKHNIHTKLHEHEHRTCGEK